MRRRRFFVGVLLLAGCAAPRVVQEQKPAAPPPPAVTAHPWRSMIVYVPQTDEGATNWPKWFAKNPPMHMVIAMSPRFSHLAKDPFTKLQLLALKKMGRLDIALQIPNAPVLPLIIQNPPYGYQEDVIQLIAQAKAGFFKTWNFLPQGLVLPYGASSPELINLLERLGFTYVITAAGLPAIDGPYQSGAMAVWDATPSGRPSATVVHVWDERQSKEHPLEGWIAEVKAKTGEFLLPHDAGIATTLLSLNQRWKIRSWELPDSSAWIGSPAKDAAWNALRRTREALEKYKNSGQASVGRLDGAFEEIYSAQNANFFTAMGNSSLPPALVEEREHEYQATLLSVFRMTGETPPEDLSSATPSAPVAAAHTSSTTIRAESFPDGRDHVSIVDATGDALLPGGPDLRSLDVWASSSSIDWVVTLGSATTTPSIDIYVDLNGQPNIGTPMLLPGRPFATSPKDAWEYAIAIVGPTATLYRTDSSGNSEIVQTFPVVVDGAAVHVTVPRDLIHGSPKRWGYQVLVMNGKVSDFIDPLEISQKDLWQDLSSGKRNDIPFVRARIK